MNPVTVAIIDSLKENLTNLGLNNDFQFAPPGWLSGERVGLMTWWLRVRSPVEATFLSGVFSPLTSAEACEKSSRWLWKEKLLVLV